LITWAHLAPLVRAFADIRLADAWELFGYFKKPPGTFRLTAGSMKTISPTLNLWGGIGFSSAPRMLRLDFIGVTTTATAGERGAALDQALALRPYVLARTCLG
jgi:hypothetical protein